jgi:hypothetical protein
LGLAPAGSVEVMGSVENSMVTVTHFTDAATVGKITNGTGTLNAGSFVTLPSQVTGLTASGVESALEIEAGRGAFSTTFQTPASNLGPAFNGPLTSGQKTPMATYKPNKTRSICPYTIVMKNTQNIYTESFPKGVKVKIAPRSFLENFLATWKFHNKLEPYQLNFADQIAEVEAVGFYHGGDQLYRLKGIPGIWHEHCLKTYTPQTDTETA